MNRWLAVVTVGLMLVVPVVSSASSASWLRSGYDPGRTGAIPFEGPQTNDTAFQVKLPGQPYSPTTIVDGEAYVGTRATDYEGLDTAALWRINLDGASTEKVIDLPPETSSIWKVGPDLSIVDRPQEVQGQCCAWERLALDVPSGEQRWKADPTTEAMPFGWFTEGVVIEGTYYTGLIASPVPDFSSAQAGVVAIDMTSGEELWRWLRTTDEEAAIPALPAPEGPGPAGAPGEGAFYVSISGGDDRLYPYIQFHTAAVSDPERETWISRSQNELWGLDIAEGTSLWKRSDTEQHEVYTNTPIGTIYPLEARGFVGGMAAVTENRVHVRLDAFQALNPATGETLWTSPAGRADEIQFQGINGLGADGDVFVGTTSQTAYRFDATTGDLVWQRTDTSPTKFYTSRPVALSADTAYAQTYHFGPELDGEGRGLTALDVETGETRWAWERVIDQELYVTTSAGFGPGVAVVPLGDGRVHVLGETEASLGAPKVDDEMYPAPGEEVTLDLSDTEPGAFGEATRYRVFWGDGTVSGWQQSPTFTHVYNETGEVEARLQAGNEANQTASTFVTMHVGGTQPNWLSERFAPENQDMTFGLLGVALALGGGVFGVARRYRSRSRLEDELEAVEQAYEETQHRPMECEAQLTERKTHARGLLLDGELTEEQFRIVENRIEELLRGLRLEAVEDEFDFLPHRLVKRGREMLEDGQVTSLEREAFLRAVEEDAVLTDEQKVVVRERIDEWYARDQGGRER